MLARFGGRSTFNGMNKIGEIKARLDIVDVVSETVALRKSGKNFTGFCPFHHNTNTPSFVVFPETQSWRCFGACSDGGDLFSFVMRRDGAEFKEALELLADKAGVSLERTPSPADEADEKERQKLLDLNAAAAEYFHHQLTRTSAGAVPREYLVRRQLTAETIATFQLGYALNEWEALKKHFLERGYTPKELADAGLLTVRDDGTKSYDRFRHRLMIPIRNIKGQVIGFGARALDAEQVPKYLNSPQSRLFDKSATLYGFDLARQYIRQLDQAIIVEGYMDVIQAFQQNARNVVAQMGTALTEQQLKILKRQTSNFVLALDSDAAGNTATFRGINLAREALDRETVPVPTARGLIRYEGRLKADIRIAEMPPGKDPDDILKEGLDGWQRIIDQAKPIVDFYFDTVTAGLDMNDAKEKKYAVDKLLPVLRDISDKVEQQHYVQKLARLIRVPEETVNHELVSRASGTSKPNRTPALIKPTSSATPPLVQDTGLEEYCLSFIIGHPAALAGADFVLEQNDLPGLTFSDFMRSENKNIFRAIQLWTASEPPDANVLSQMVDQSLADQLEILVKTSEQLPETPQDRAPKALWRLIVRLRLQDFDGQIKELSVLLQEAREDGDSQAIAEYTKMVEKLGKQRKALEQVRNSLSVSGQRRTEKAY
jgi:DNA primase